MLKRRPRTRWFAVVGMTIGAASVGACTKNPYVIGAVCPLGDGGSPIDAPCATGGDAAGDGTDGTDGGSDATSTFAAELDHSGAMALGPLDLPPSVVLATLTLRGERAAATGWPTDEGATLARGGGAPETGLLAPFTDGTAAAGLAADAPSYVASAATVGAVGADDFAVEIVLRAAPGATIADKRAGSAGWALRTDANSALVLSVGDADPGHLVEASAPLVAGAWYHCLAWVSRAAGARVDCDGRAGTLVALAATGALDVATPLALGGGAAVRVARLTLTRVAPGGLGDPAGWQDAARLRFATLAGARPSVHMGTALPRAGLRDSPAYVDLQAAAGDPRQLFLVGPDWPRIACRTDVAGVHDCGFLSEPLRMRRVPADARMWTGSGLDASVVGPPLPVEGPPLIGLVLSTAATTHSLSVMAVDTPARQVLSFFARGGTSSLVAARVGGLGNAVYDLLGGTVVLMPAGVSATIEDWGGGLRRCIYAYTGVAGPVSHVLTVLDNTGATLFAGDGFSSGIQVAGLQVDLGLVFAGSLLAADMQPADHLTFVGNDGNLPAASGATIDVRVLLPEGPRLTDQAIFNLNRGAAFADQVQLFVVGGTVGDTGLAEFWGISTGQTYWNFANQTATMIDGRRHVLQASWNQTSAHIVADQMTQDKPVLLPNPPPFVLDRIDIGFSEKSGGPLEGLVAGLRIGAP